MKPSHRRAGNRHAPQKSFLCFSRFARARFFLLKGKENFFVLLCSDEQGGGDGLCLSLGRGGIPPPNPLLPPRPRTRNGNLRLFQKSRDSCDGTFGVFTKRMSPQDHNLPAVPSQDTEDFFVPRSVFLQFGFPKLARQNILPCWQSPTVPKIAVKKNRFARFRQCYIRVANNAAIMRLELQTALSQKVKQLLFKNRIFGSYRRHNLASFSL